MKGLDEGYNLNLLDVMKENWERVSEMKTDRRWITSKILSVSKKANTRSIYECMKN